jgi:hypothetical protein
MTFRKLDQWLRLALSKGPIHLRTAIDTVSETSCFLVSRIPGRWKRQKKNSLCYTPSSEPYRICYAVTWTNITVHWSLVIVIPGVYSANNAFEFRSEDRQFWLRFSWFLLLPQEKFWNSTWIGHDRLLRQSLQFTIRNKTIIRRNITYI